jgi:signal transduction histidine kinase
VEYLNLWEQHRWLIVSAVSLFVLQTLLVASLLVLLARHRQSERILRTNEAALRTSYERSRRLAGRLINSREVVRARIARDLHDDVCQELAGLSIELSNLRCRRGDVQNPVTQDAMTALQRRMLALVEVVRRLSHDLHPSTLRHIGIAAAVETLCIEIEQRYDVQVSFATDGNLEDVRPTAALCLFRIAQEALRNAAVYGKARRVTVSIAESEKDIELTVIDDGKGFDLDAAHRGGHGLGLDSMEERAHLMGGQLYILTQPGQGTTIRVHLPDTVSVDTHEEIDEFA